MEFGRAVKLFRLKENLTQEQLAEGICSKTYLSKVENGKLTPSEEIINLLCNRMNVSFETLANYDSIKLNKRFLEWYREIRQKKWSAAEILQHEIEEIINLLKYSSREFDYQVILAYSHVCRNELEQGERLLTPIKERFEYLDDLYEYIYWKTNGLLYLKKQNYECSIVSFEKALKINGRIMLTEPEVYYNLSISYSRFGQYPLSNLNIEKAIMLYQEVLNYNRVIDCYVLLGINYNGLENYNLAEEYFLKVLNSTTSTDEIKKIVIHNLGYCYFKQKDYQQAVKRLTESKNMSNEKYVFRTNYLLSVSYSETGNIDLARSLISDSINKAVELKNLEYVYKNQLLLAKINGNLYTSEMAQFIIREVIPFFKVAGDRDDYKELFLILGKIEYQNRNYKKSSEFLFEYIDKN